MTSGIWEKLLFVGIGITLAILAMVIVKLLMDKAAAPKPVDAAPTVADQTALAAAADAALARAKAISTGDDQLAQIAQIEQIADPAEKLKQLSDLLKGV
jgi:hypothetical protein